MMQTGRGNAYATRYARPGRESCEKQVANVSHERHGLQPVRSAKHPSVGSPYPPSRRTSPRKVAKLSLGYTRSATACHSVCSPLLQIKHLKPTIPHLGPSLNGACNTSHRQLATSTPSRYTSSDTVRFKGTYARSYGTPPWRMYTLTRSSNTHRNASKYGRTYGSI